jgi:hypothetical protein
VFLTTLGTAHDESFQSDEQKIEEKIKLFKHVTVLICCADHDKLFRYVKSSGIPFLSWGFSPVADVKVAKKDGEFLVTWRKPKFYDFAPLFRPGICRKCTSLPDNFTLPWVQIFTLLFKD